jgi:glycosyltransferase involved in cell wall biosynthesis
MKVVLFMRRPRRGANFSVELFMQNVVDNLSTNFEPVVAVSRFESNGVFRRLYNVVEAAARQGAINHVTGDVNFLTYLLRKDRTVLTILDCGPIIGDSDLRKKLLKLFWFTIPAKRCAAITVISEAVKQQLIELVGVDPEKVHVVPVAVPTMYRPSPRPFNSERPTILQVGASANKNRERLIEALSGISCRLELVGRLSEVQHERLKQLNIEYAEYVGLSNEQMLERYQNCDLVAFPSVFEGFGMPIIEGNLVGRPVVTGNVASMPEVAGDAACLVDPFDATSIRQGILKIINEPDYRAQLVRNGFENAKRYSADSITKQYEEIYGRIASAVSA